MKKKLQNFWYYNKIYIIIALAVLAAVLWFRLQDRQTTPADYHAAIVSPRGCTDEQLAKLRSALEQAGEDQNGDGIVSVTVRVYRFALGEDGQERTEIAKLDADLVGKQSGIFFIEDPERFEEATNGIGKAADAVPVKNIPLLSDCGIDDLSLLVRTGADPKYPALLQIVTLRTWSYLSH